MRGRSRPQGGKGERSDWRRQTAGLAAAGPEIDGGSGGLAEAATAKSGGVWACLATAGQEWRRSDPTAA
jgi:hypothetical protein